MKKTPLGFYIYATTGLRGRQNVHFIFTAADRRCRYSRRGISMAPSGWVAGVYLSDSIRGTALGKCFYPKIDIEQEQTPMNREQAELTEKNTWIGKEERRLPARRDGETNRNEPDRRPALRDGFTLCFLRFLL
jgi:hypothetical protein